MNINNTETIEILSTPEDIEWVPEHGEETLFFRGHLAKLKISETDSETIVREATSVLSQCLPPTEAKGKKTGLVIGYVQSGKTLSFTAVATVARDNNYKLIIVLTGINTNLYEQSRDRLWDDLQLLSRDDRKWQYFANPKAKPDEKQRVAKAIHSNAALAGITPQTALIAVMKNKTHLENLLSLLRGLSLNGIPTLIIDDEADQASLNNKVRKGEQSPTYRRILELRNLLPHHTFLQYTATPQALLLINLIDSLSPSFAQVLTPGPAYTGGKAFFEKDLRLVRLIPDEDVDLDGATSNEVPASLLEAIRIFLLGVAVGMMSGGKKNRSMMVHPSKRTIQHADAFNSVRQTQLRWLKIMTGNTKEPDYGELIQEFRSSYIDLKSTVQDLPAFEEIVRYLPGAIKETIIREENARQGKAQQIDWRQNYAHILIGGDKLNRGFTVEGLTVTYMPRGKGVGNADTIEQRARWFGYKADYLGFCRVYLDEEMRENYRSYVIQEESIRTELRKFIKTGKPLSEWTRVFFISESLRPTRSSVLDLEYGRGNFSNRWYEPHAPHAAPAFISENNRVVEELLSKLKMEMELVKSHAESTEEEQYFRASVPLKFAYENLLTRLKLAHPRDIQDFWGLLLNLSKHLETHPDEECLVCLMAKGKLRTRSVNDTNEIPHIFGGPTPSRGKFKRGEIYPGDREIKNAEEVTIQIHNLRVRKDGTNIAVNVPAITVWVPTLVDSGYIAGPGQPSSNDLS